MSNNAVKNISKKIMVLIPFIILFSLIYWYLYIFVGIFYPIISSNPFSDLFFLVKNNLPLGIINFLILLLSITVVFIIFRLEKAIESRPHITIIRVLAMDTFLFIYSLTDKYLSHTEYFKTIHGEGYSMPFVLCMVLSTFTLFLYFYFDKISKKRNHTISDILTRIQSDRKYEKELLKPDLEKLKMWREDINALNDKIISNQNIPEDVKTYYNELRKSLEIIDLKDM